MAVSVEVPSVSLDAAELMRGIPSQDVPVVARDAANRIASVLGLEPAQVERKILGKRRFNWLKRQISAEEADKIRALSSDDGPERRVRGLTVEGEGRRYYPRRELASALLGFVAPDGEGKDGLEYALNAELAGRVESLNGLRDRSGRLIFSEGIDDERALAGHDIQLAIDQGIQYVAERELLQAMRTFEAKGGSVVVLDPNTGEILALASAPLYNPNDYRESEPEARRDRGSAEAFEPGSTAKIFTIAAGLAAGVVKAGDRLYCENGSMAVDNVTIRDTHPAEWLEPLASPGRLLEHLRRQDRALAGREPAVRGAAPLRLRREDRHRLAGRGDGHAAPARPSLGAGRDRRGVVRSGCQHDQPSDRAGGVVDRQRR